MLLRLCPVLLALTVEASFPARTPQTLRQRFGKPISETFLVRPGIVVTARYGASGNTCELLIRPEKSDEITNESNSDIDYDLLNGIEDELVPVAERGKYVMGTFLDFTCLWGDDCGAGTQEDWENVVIYRNAGKNGARYCVIKWTRHECGPKIGVHLHEP